jgi:hypothetical protein
MEATEILMDDIRPRRGRPPKTIGEKIAANMVKLDERERKITKREVKRIAFEATLADWDKVLTLAEKWDEQLSVVLRAALRQGLDHYLNWASNSAPYSPFVKGDLHQPRPPHRLDPSGLQFPPPPLQTFGHNTVVSTIRPPSRQITREISEPVFAQPEQTMVRVGRRGPAVSLAALLPNGATESSPIPDDIDRPESLAPQVDQTGIFDENPGS